jgi:acetolactate synthase-1/2/3 large subunit
MSAKGSFPEDHPLSLGYFGWSGLRPAIDSMLSSEVEVIIVLGSRLNMQDSMFWNEKFSKINLIKITRLLY